MSVPHAATVALLLLTLPGCHATLYGNQSTGGGTTTTTTASHVSGSTKFSGGKASFSSGNPIPPNAPGGTLRVSGSAAGVLVVGLVFLDFVNYVVGPTPPTPLAPDVRIADTCSCYKKPVSSE